MEQFQKIQNIINLKENDKEQFQMALKAEIEEISSLKGKQNIENLTLLKGITNTMRNLKESY
jgi:hypothetical protein